MKILLTCDVIEKAGITTYCENLAEGLTDSGHEVILLAGSTSHYPSKYYSPPKAINKSVFIERGISTANSHLKKYIKCIKEINPDVIIINNSPFVLASLPYLPWHIIRIPVIHSIRETDVKPFLALHFWWDRALAVSPLISRVAKGLPGSTKLYDCPLGIKVDALNNRTGETATKNQPLNLVWAGRIEESVKRADLIACIAMELENEKIPYFWTVLGDGNDSAKVVSTLKEKGINNKFRFRGTVTRQQVLETFSVSDVLVMPSDHEGLSQALLEAMSMGVIPVVSKIPGSTDFIIRDGKEGYLCERGKPVAFARKIVALDRDRKLLSTMGKASMDRVRFQFNHHVFAERVIQNILDTVEEGVARGAPLQLGEITTDIPEMKGRSCSGLLWSIGIMVKWGIIARFQRILSVKNR